MSSSLFTCNQCGAALSEDDIDPRRRRATCRFCGAVTDCPVEPEAVDVPAAVVPAAPPAASEGIRPKVPRPSSIQYSESTEGIRLARRWFTPGLIFLLFFCIAWDGFLVFWYSMAIGGAGPQGFFSWIFILFPICHVAVGIGLTYFVIAGFLNRTVIDVSRDELRVWHGPVPWKGNKTLLVEHIDQLYCSSAQSRSQNSQSFSVNVLLKDSRQEKLCSMLSSSDEARYIVRAIEDYLGLQHHPVAGEIA